MKQLKLFIFIIVFLAIAVNVNALTLISTCQSLGTAGETYQLSASILNSQVFGGCLNVTAANIVVDCVGYTMQGNLSINFTTILNTSNQLRSRYAIYSRAANTTVKNCNIEKWQYGIYYNASNNGLVTNNNITNLFGFKGNDTGVASQTFLTQPGGEVAGVYLYNSTGNTITTNFIAYLLGGVGGWSSATNSGAFTGQGGRAEGIGFEIATGNTITSNNIQNITGGRGGSSTPAGTAQTGAHGGQTSAFSLLSSSGNIFTNNNASNVLWGVGGAGFQFMTGFGQNSTRQVINVRDTISLNNTFTKVYTDGTYYYPNSSTFNYYEGQPILAFFGQNKLNVTGYTYTSIVPSLNYNETYSAITLASCTNSFVISNNISNLTAPPSEYLAFSPQVNITTYLGIGGTAAPINIINSQNVTIRDNNAYNITSGEGAWGQWYSGGSGSAGGIATVVSVMGGANNTLQNNFGYNFIPGKGGLIGRTGGTPSPGALGRLTYIYLRSALQNNITNTFMNRTQLSSNFSVSSYCVYTNASTAYLNNLTSDYVTACLYPNIVATYTYTGAGIVTPRTNGSLATFSLNLTYNQTSNAGVWLNANTTGINIVRTILSTDNEQSIVGNFSVNLTQAVAYTGVNSLNTMNNTETLSATRTTIYWMYYVADNVGNVNQTGYYATSIDYLDNNTRDCYVFERPNTIYTLSTDILNAGPAPLSISTCMDVRAANVTLDCAGHTIQGNLSMNFTLNKTVSWTYNQYAIYSNQYNSTFKNCNIEKWQYGIYLNKSNNGLYENNNISNLYGHSGPNTNTVLVEYDVAGAYILNSQGNTFKQNIIKNLFGGKSADLADSLNGIYVANGGTATGFALDNGTNNIITDNQIINMTGGDAGGGSSSLKGGHGGSSVGFTLRNVSIGNYFARNNISGLVERNSTSCGGSNPVNCGSNGTRAVFLFWDWNNNNFNNTITDTYWDGAQTLINNSNLNYYEGNNIIYIYGKSIINISGYIYSSNVATIQWNETYPGISLINVFGGTIYNNNISNLRASPGFYPQQHPFLPTNWIPNGGTATAVLLVNSSNVTIYDNNVINLRSGDGSNNYKYNIGGNVEAIGGIVTPVTIFGGANNTLYPNNVQNLTVGIGGIFTLGGTIVNGTSTYYYFIGAKQNYVSNHFFNSSIAQYCIYTAQTATTYLDNLTSNYVKSCIVPNITTAYTYSGAIVSPRTSGSNGVFYLNITYNQTSNAGAWLNANQSIYLTKTIMSTDNDAVTPGNFTVTVNNTIPPIYSSGLTITTINSTKTLSTTRTWIYWTYYTVDNLGGIAQSPIYTTSIDYLSNILTDCAILDRPNTIYYVGNDILNAGIGLINLTTCMEIRAANITLECQGYQLQGNLSTSAATLSYPTNAIYDLYGVYSTQYGTVVQNCNINRWQKGIYFNGTNNGNINTNNINNLTGAKGYVAAAGQVKDGGNAIAVTIANGANNMVHTNIVGGLLGGTGSDQSAGYTVVGNGGWATFVELINATGNTVYNNVIDNLTGGQGGTGIVTAGSYPGTGGATMGFSLSNSSNNNYIYYNAITNLNYGLGGTGPTGPLLNNGTQAVFMIWDNNSLRNTYQNYVYWGDMRNTLNGEKVLILSGTHSDGLTPGWTQKAAALQYMNIYAAVVLIGSEGVSITGGYVYNLTGPIGYQNSYPYKPYGYDINGGTVAAVLLIDSSPDPLVNNAGNYINGIDVQNITGGPGGTSQYGGGNTAGGGGWATKVMLINSNNNTITGLDQAINIAGGLAGKGTAGAGTINGNSTFLLLRNSKDNYVSGMTLNNTWTNTTTTGGAQFGIVANYSLPTLPGINNNASSAFIQNINCLNPDKTKCLLPNPVPTFTFSSTIPSNSSRTYGFPVYFQANLSITNTNIWMNNYYNASNGENPTWGLFFPYFTFSDNSTGVWVDSTYSGYPRYCYLQQWTWYICVYADGGGLGPNIIMNITRTYTGINQSVGWRFNFTTAIHTGTYAVYPGGLGWGGTHSSEPVNFSDAVPNWDTTTMNEMLTTKSGNYSLITTPLSIVWGPSTPDGSVTNLSSIIMNVTTTSVASEFTNTTLYVWNRLGNIQINTTCVTLPYCTATYAALPDGPYWFNATSRDKGNWYTNTVSVDTRYAMVDKVFPTLAYGSPADNIWATTGDPTNGIILENMTTPETNTQYIIVYIYDASKNYLTEQQSGDYVTSFLANFSGFLTENALYWVNATIVDYAGKQNWSTTRNITIDTIHPSINITEPSMVNNTNQQTNYIYLNTSANDTNMQSITIRLYNYTGLRTSAPCTVAGTNKTMSCYNNFTALPDGYYWINATALDKGGNDNSTETRLIVLDNAAPVLTYLEPWDINPLSVNYTNAFNVNANDSAPTGLFFSPDGIQMYMVGQTSDYVNQYNLSKAWDTSTAVYRNRTYVGGQEATAQGVFINSDGTKMYIVGTTTQRVFQYNLTIPWQVNSSILYKNISISANETVPTDLFFSSDGTKMYIIGQTNDRVNQYSLSTPWDISTAVYQKLFSVAGQEATSTGLFFKSDGTQMYVTGSTSRGVYQYNLSIPWEVNTSTYQKTYSVAGQDTSPQAVSFKSDGRAMYMLGFTGKNVYWYNLSQTDNGTIDNRTTINEWFTSSDGNLYNITTYLYNGSGALYAAETIFMPYGFAGLYNWKEQYLRVLSPGTYYFNATACDTNGKCTNLPTRTVLLTWNITQIYFDNAITSGIGSNFSGITIGTYVNSGGFTNQTIRLYNATGGLINTTTTTSPIFNITYQPLVDGIYYFNATAYDTIGDIGYTETRTTTVDTAPPEINWALTPITGSTVNSGYFVIVSSVPHPQLTNYTVYVYNSTGLYNATTYYDYQEINTQQFINVPDDTYYMNITAYDIANNQNITITRTLTLLRNMTAPNITQNAGRDWFNKSWQAYQYGIPYNYYYTNTTIITPGNNYVTIYATIKNATGDTLYTYNANSDPLNFTPYNCVQDTNATTPDAQGWGGGPANTYYLYPITINQSNNPTCGEIPYANETLINIGSYAGYPSYAPGRSADDTFTYVRPTNTVNASWTLRYSGVNYTVIVPTTCLNRSDGLVKMHFSTQTGYDSPSFTNLECYANSGVVFITNVTTVSVYLGTHNTTMNWTLSPTNKYPEYYKPLIDGNYTYNITATRTDGILSTMEVPFIIDTVYPVIVLNNGTDLSGSYPKDYIQTNSSVIDINPINITHRLYNATTLLNTTVTTDTTLFSNYTDLPAGYYTLNVTAIDVAGNTQTTTISILLDAVNPGLTINNILNNTINGPVYDANNLKTNITITDNFAIGNTTMYIYNQSDNALIGTSVVYDNMGYQEFTNITYPFSTTTETTYNYNPSTAGASGGDYLYINYTKPYGALNTSQWQVSHGYDSVTTFGHVYNITLPAACWNAYPDKLVLRIYSLSRGGVETYNSNPQCYNGSVWGGVGNSYSEGYAGGASGTGIDGNYSTGFAKNYNGGPSGDPNSWSWSARRNGGTIWEEAMYWKLNTTIIMRTPTLPDGNYTFQITTYDTAGNYNASEYYNFSLIYHPPGIYFEADTTPAGYSLISTITVNMTGIDDNFANMTLTLRNTTGVVAINTTTNLNVYTQYIVPDGNYTFIGDAYDYATNTNTTGIRNVFIDTINPTLQLVPPTNTAGKINVTANDTNWANLTIVVLNETGGIKYNVTTINKTYYNDFGYLPTGTYYVNITARDIVGRINNTVQPIYLDTVNPIITFINSTIVNVSGINVTYYTELNGTSVYNRSTINIYVSAYDVNLRNIVFNIYNSTGLEYNQSFTATNQTFNQSLIYTIRSEGYYYINVTAYDQSDNKNNTETRTIYYDVQPRIIFNTPNDAITNISYPAAVNRTYVQMNITAIDITFQNMTIQEMTSTGATDTCFQEYTNTTPCLNYALDPVSVGPYNANQENYLYMNYSKPPLATRDSKWQIKYGYNGTTPYFINITIPYGCWDAYNDRVVLRFGSSAIDLPPYFSNAQSQPYCYNSIEWIPIGPSSKQPGSLVSYLQPEETNNPIYGYDGDYSSNTFFVTAFDNAYALWKGNCVGACYNALYEEGMVWVYPVAFNYSNYTTSTNILLNYTGLLDAEYFTNVTAIDNHTNDRPPIQQLSVAKVIVDNALPNVQFVYPGTDSGTVYRNFILISGKVVDDTPYNLTFNLYNSTGALKSSVTKTYRETYNLTFSNLPNDQYFINMTAYDIVGHVNYSETINITIIVDNQPPIISFNPDTTPNGTKSDNIIINVTGDDTYFWYIDINLYTPSGTLLYQNISYNKTYYENYSYIIDGVYKFNATVHDLGYNTNYTETRTATKDTTPPRIIFDNSTTINGARSKTLFVRVNVSDLTFTNQTLSVYDENGTLKYNATYNGTTTCPSGTLFGTICSVYSTTLTGTTLPDGLYYYNSTAYDQFGRSNNTDTRNVTIDNTGPATEFVPPTQPTNTVQSSFGIEINVTSNDTNYKNVTINLYNSTGSKINTTTTNDTNLYVNYTVIEGVYTYNAIGVDTLGNTNTTPTRTILIDNSAPIIQFVSPSTPSNGLSSSVKMNITATDMALANITINIYNSTGDLIFSQTTNTSPNYYNYVNVTDGATYYFNATAYDQFGRVNYTETRNTSIDLLNPTIVYNAPTYNYTGTDGLIIGKSIAVNVTGADSYFKNLSIQLYLGGTLLYRNWSNNTNYYINYTNLADGNYAFNATAYDQASNTNTTNTIQAVIDTTAPVFTFSSPTSGQNYVDSALFTYSTTELHFANKTFKLYYNVSGNLTEIYSNYSTSSGIYNLLLTGIDGTYYYNVTGYDTYGNFGNTSLFYITLGNRPKINYTTPTETNGTTLSSNKIKVNVTLNDTNLNITYIYLLNSSGGVSQVVNITGNATYFYNEFTVGSDGNYSFYAITFDLTGLNASTPTRRVKVDSTLPYIYFEANTDADGHYKNRDTIFINVTATSGSFKNMTVYIYDENNDLLYNITTTTSMNLVVNWTVPKNGPYEFYATVWDNHPFTNSTETRRVIIDTIKPNIVYEDPTPPANQTVIVVSSTTDTIIINVTSNDTNYNTTTLTVIDTINNYTIYEATYNATDKQVTIPQLYNGNYTITATAVDFAGNTATETVANIIIYYSCKFPYDSTNITEEWVIDASNNCTIDKYQNAEQQDLIITGSGTVYIDATVNNYKNRIIQGGAQVITSSLGRTSTEHLPPPPLFYYNCDDIVGPSNNITEISDIVNGPAYNLYTYGNTVSQVPGIYNQACNMPAGSTGFTAPIPLHNIFSWCGYVNVSDTSLYTGIFGYAAYDPFKEIDLSIINDELVLKEYSTTWPDLTYPYTYSGETHFICFALDSIRHREDIWIDGLPVASLQDDNIYLMDDYTEGFFLIVPDYTLNTGDFTIDETGIFDRYLTDDDVAFILDKYFTPP